MKVKESGKWSWPERGSDPDKVRERLVTEQARIIDYDHHTVLGFPGTSPLPEALKAFESFVPRQPNNIGCHTRRPEGAEYGFAGTQALEREYIWRLSTILGATDPEHEVDGHICSGGTEGNFTGLWIGREKLKAKLPPGSRIAVLKSFFTHYSVDKGSGQLAIDIHTLGTDGYGRLDPEILVGAIRRLFLTGTRGFVIVLNAGTIFMGAIDPVDKVCESLKLLKEELEKLGPVEFYVHVDAAFGGYVIPFLTPVRKFAFDCELVDSVAIDAHKMGYAPYAAGVFLCRKDCYPYVAREIDYMGGHVDETSCGSRSGAIAAACWAALETLGIEGYKIRVEDCMRMMHYLTAQLSKIPGTRPFPVQMNIVSVRFSAKVEALMRDGMAARFCIPRHDIPEHFSDPNSPKYAAFRFVCMPHVTREHIDEFINAVLERIEQ